MVSGKKGYVVVILDALRFIVLLVVRVRAGRRAVSWSVLVRVGFVLGWGLAWPGSVAGSS